MIRRSLETELSNALARQAAVALIGPRQVGKTTIAHAVAEPWASLYLDLEASETRQRLSDPAAFLERFSDRLVILDEVHRVPELFAALRGLIDEGRRSGRRTGRFLLLGSASIELLRQSSESLAGRIAFLELTPFLAPEISDSRDDLERLWLRGGFPESFLADTDATSIANRRDFFRTYVHRDVREFVPRISVDAFERFWYMLAHLHGGPVQAANLATSLGIAGSTVSAYLDLLVHLLLVRKLPAFHENFGKRLVKAPKVYLRDSGILHYLLGIESYFQLAGHPKFGASWESFVIENLLAVGTHRFASYYRTHAGAEIDLVLEYPHAGRVAIEIKAGRTFKLERGFHHARADLQPARTYVVADTDVRYPLGDGIEVIGLQALCKELHTLR